ncbi:hypothetical protein ACLB9X_34205, partial [Streptomyces sp. 5K101]
GTACVHSPHRFQQATGIGPARSASVHTIRRHQNNSYTHEPPTYDFFAKCPHRLACARCPLYVPKESTRGQLLAVKDGINQMLERLDLTDDEREALEGDRKAVAALTERLADTPPPAGPTPTELGTADSFVPLTQLMKTIAPDKGDQETHCPPRTPLQTPTERPHTISDSQ